MIPGGMVSQSSDDAPTGPIDRDRRREAAATARHPAGRRRSGRGGELDATPARRQRPDRRRAARHRPVPAVESVLRRRDSRQRPDPLRGAARGDRAVRHRDRRGRFLEVVRRAVQPRDGGPASPGAQHPLCAAGAGLRRVRRVRDRPVRWHGERAGRCGARGVGGNRRLPAERASSGHRRPLGTGSRRRRAHRLAEVCPAHRLRLDGVGGAQLWRQPVLAGALRAAKRRRRRRVRQAERRGHRDGGGVRRGGVGRRAGRRQVVTARHQGRSAGHRRARRVDAGRRDPGVEPARWGGTSTRSTASRRTRRPPGSGSRAIWRGRRPRRCSRRAPCSVTGTRPGPRRAPGGRRPEMACCS